MIDDPDTQRFNAEVASLFDEIGKLCAHQKRGVVICALIEFLVMSTKQAANPWVEYRECFLPTLNDEMERQCGPDPGPRESVQ